MSNYTKDSPDIYFLNDKSIVSSYDAVPTNINPIPSFDLAVSGHNELTCFKSGATLSIAGLCIDLSTADRTISKQVVQIDELSTFKGDAAKRLQKLSSDLASVSSDTTVNTLYMKDLIGFDTPYSGGKIKALSDDVEALKQSNIQSIKFRYSLQLVAEDDGQSLIDILKKANILTKIAPYYLLNGTLVNVFLPNSTGKKTVTLKLQNSIYPTPIDIVVGNGDMLVFHVPDPFADKIFAKDFKLVTATAWGNFLQIKAGVSMYDLEAEVSARISADNILCSVLSNDAYTKELGYSEISSIDEIAASYGKDHWNNGDTIIVKKHLFEEADKTACEYTGYVFKNSTWQAMDGNYNADNVYINHEFTLAGNYKSIGNINKVLESTISTFFCKDKLTSLFERMFAIHEDPAVLDQPTLTLSVKNGLNLWPEYAEVGTTITPVLTATLTRGRYTPWKVCTETDHSGIYRQNPTNVSELTCVVQSTYDHYEEFTTESPDTRSGSWLTANTSFDLTCSLDPRALSADKPYKITVKPDYNDDVKVALDNEGKETIIKVNLTTDQKTTATIIPYYKAFYGSQAVVSAFVEGADATALRSVSTIKSTTSTLVASTIKFNSGTGTRQLVIVLPHEGTKTWKITKFYDGTAYADIQGLQGPVAMKINDAGGTARNYDVWHVDYGPDINGKMDKHEIQVTIA